MYGIWQRPTSDAAHVHRRAGQLEVHWRARPPAEHRRSRKTRRDVGTGDLAQAVALIVCLAVLTAVMYGLAGQRGTAP